MCWLCMRTGGLAHNKSQVLDTQLDTTYDDLLSAFNMSPLDINSFFFQSCYLHAT